MNITFACKIIKEEDLIKCAFNINKTSYRILKILLKSEEKLKIVDISKELNLKRCTIQKSLKKLLKKGLISRSQKNLKKGGYIYYYHCKNKKELKNKIKNLLQQWYKNALDRLEKF
jgi:predicted transcriptional regulator